MLALNYLDAAIWEKVSAELIFRYNSLQLMVLSDRNLDLAGL